VVRLRLRLVRGLLHLADGLELSIALGEVHAHHGVALGEQLARPHALSRDGLGPRRQGESVLALVGQLGRTVHELVLLDYLDGNLDAQALHAQDVSHL